MSLLLTGGTGFVGSAVAEQLVLRGSSFLIVTRENKQEQKKSVVPLPAPGQLFSAEIIAEAESVINLAGESIAGNRWNTRVRHNILQSRVEITSCIVKSIRRNQELSLPYPKVLVNASAMGYYGTHSKQRFTENSGNGHGFLAEVCRRWEDEAVKAEDLGIRVVRLRFGHVLERNGGLLSKVVLPFYFGVGGYLGDGQQWMSWIHRKDLVRMILQAVGDETWQGVYNACTPNAVNMQEFMEVLGKTLGSKSRTRVPAFLVKLLLGDMAEEVLLKGQRGYPKRLLGQNYEFQFSTLSEAFIDIFKK